MEVLNPDGGLSDEARAATDEDLGAALLAATAEYEQHITARQSGDAAEGSAGLKTAAARVAALRSLQRERQIAAGTRTAGVSVNAQDNVAPETPTDTTEG